ncbi:MAG: PLP-dependent aminotransferase family protein [Pseudomonadota bacterium]
MGHALSETTHIINFAIGQPSPDLLPVALFERMARECTARLDPAQLNYGDYAGDPAYLESLSRFLSEHYQFPVDPSSLFLTAGASHGIDTACRLLCAPDDVVLVEEPTYFLALEIFASQGLRAVPVAMDEQGVRVDALREALEMHPNAKVLYTIPAHHNPTSVTMSAERRREVLALTRGAGVTVVADEVYQLLHFDGRVPPPAPFAAEVHGGGVISVGSFSKLLAPAMRVGWVQSDPSTIARLCALGVIRSGGAINQVGSLLVAASIDSGVLDAHLRECLVPALAARAQVMGDALTHGLGNSAVRWRQATGGYFYWLHLPQDCKTDALLANSREAGVGFHPGKLFSAAGEQGNTLRLSFAHYPVGEVEEGIKRLVDQLHQHGV